MTRQNPKALREVQVVPRAEAAVQVAQVWDPITPVSLFVQFLSSRLASANSSAEFTEACQAKVPGIVSTNG